MTHTSCPVCRLRLTRAAALGLGVCPRCDGPLVAASAADVFGFALVDASDPAVVAAVALAESLRGPQDRDPS